MMQPYLETPRSVLASVDENDEDDSEDEDKGDKDPEESKGNGSVRKKIDTERAKFFFRGGGFGKAALKL